jgi:cell division septation protein DedD
MPMTPDPGMLAESSPAAGKNPESGKEAKALPPHPQPKPEVPAMAKAEPQAAAEKPEEMAAGDAAHAVVLHLSSLRSEEAAKREGSDLQHNFPRPLAAMPVEIHRTEHGEKGPVYRVLAGPLPSQAKAKEVCAELKAKDAKQYCRILPSKPKAS